MTRKIEEEIEQIKSETEENAEKNINDWVDNIRAQLNHAEEQVVSYAKENPLKALGIAVLTGVAAAHLLRRKK